MNLYLYLRYGAPIFCRTLLIVTKIFNNVLDIGKFEFMSMRKSQTFRATECKVLYLVA